MRSPATRKSTTVGGDGLQVISSLAAVASSGGPVEDRAEEILAGLLDYIAADGAILSHVNPVSGQGRTIACKGYADELANYLNLAFHAEFIEPFALPRGGWPVRELDLPVDPLSLPVISDYFRPAGLLEGLTSAIHTSGGRYVGFLDISKADGSHPSDEDCAVVGCLTTAIANVIDPLESARRLASSLPATCEVLGIHPDGTVIPFSGMPDRVLLESMGTLTDAVERLLPTHANTVSFLWPGPGRKWYGCHASRCCDAITVLAVDETPTTFNLTLRELEVMGYLADGRSNQEIASRLFITVRTVKSHVEHILEKLEVPTRAAAVACAIRHGLWVPPESGAGEQRAKREGA